jgi:hypothetical protein
MRHSQLRVYHGPPHEAGATTLAAGARETITLPLGEILPLLADAVASRRTWLNDFENDEVTISTDLYEVILAYQHFRRPSA